MAGEPALDNTFQHMSTPGLCLGHALLVRAHHRAAVRRDFVPPLRVLSLSCSLEVCILIGPPKGATSV